MIEIRESTDFELISSLLAQSPALVRPPSPQKLRREYERGARFFVAYLDGRPVGCICVKKLSFFLSEVKYLFVVEDARGRGIGSKLNDVALETAINDFRTPCIIATTIVGNAPAIAIMVRRGFRPIAIFPSPISERRLVVLLKVHRGVPYSQDYEEIVAEV